MAIERNGKGHFLKGFGGRPVGARNKLHADFIRELSRDFSEHGEGVIRILRIEDPAAYAKVIVAVLPKELVVTDSSIEQLTDDELAAAIEYLRGQIAMANDTKLIELQATPVSVPIEGDNGDSSD